MKKLSITILFILFLFPFCVKGITFNGGQMQSGASGGSCGYTSAWCKFNNDWHMTVSVKLMHFNGNGSVSGPYGTTIYYTNSARHVTRLFPSTLNIRDFTPGIGNSQVFNGNARNGYIGLDSYFGSRAGFDEAISRITGTTNLNDYVKTYSSSFPNNFHSDEGGAFGWRLVIEPLYTMVRYQGSSYYEQWALFSAKELTGLISSQGIGNVTTWDDHIVPDFSKMSFTERYDVGIVPPKQSPYSWAFGNYTVGDMGFFNYVASPMSGFGMNMVTPPYEVKGKLPCNPDKKGIKACCMDEQITPSDTRNNNLEHLTRILNFKTEINQYCGNPNRCDPDLGGDGKNVKQCCDEFGIKRDKTTQNTYDYLMRPLTQDEIDYICDPVCKYTIDVKTTENCQDSKVGYIKDWDNWSCIFKSQKTNYDEVKVHYLNHQNAYCLVYCKEEISYELPDESASTRSGRYLTIGAYATIEGTSNVIKPTRMQSKLTCRTTSKKIDMTTSTKEPDGVVNKAKFLEDMRNANDYDRQRIVDSYNSCFDYAKIVNNFNPTIKFKFKDPTYKKDFNLVNLSKSTGINRKHYLGGSATNGTGSPINVNSRDTIYGYRYYRADWVEITLITDIEYTLSKGYIFMNKDTGQSFENKSEAGDNVINMGIGTLPIHFSTTPGRYNFDMEIIELNSQIKPKHKFSKFLRGNHDFAGVRYTGASKDYTCSYKVTCDKPIVISNCSEWERACGIPFCEKGVTPKFRTIALGDEIKAFPGKDGTGRTPGPNWNTGNHVRNKITWNRGVKADKVYKLRPMYEIKLTPKKMLNIRKYNKEMNQKRVTINSGTQKSSTGVGGYSVNKDIICNEDGSKCVSKIIRKWGVRGCGIKSTFYPQAGCGLFDERWGTISQLH
ncbi:MAG: hypothetical protein RSB77_01390 [Bacilli bacterium]